MDKRCIRLSLFLLPFALYTTTMFRMIDNVYQSDITAKNFGRLEDLNNEMNITTRLRKLAERYNSIERDKTLLLQTIQKTVLEAELVDRQDLVDSFVSNLVSENSETECISMKPYYRFNCSNIPKIKLRHKIGHGVTKQAFLGEYEGEEVVVKMVTRHQKEVRLCLEELRRKGDESKLSRSKCFVFSTMKLLKEILMLEQLQNEGFVKLLGYCVRNEESETTDLAEHGIVTVFEVGRRITADSLLNLSPPERIKHAISLLKFLSYLEHSPLGSLRIQDFKEDHFLYVGSDIKMIDLDDVDNLEPSCDVYNEYDDEVTNDQKRQCDFGLQCQMGLCVGHNAKQNLKKMNKLFLTRLIHPASFPEKVAKGIRILNSQLDVQNISTNDAAKKLYDLLATVE